MSNQIVRNQNFCRYITYLGDEKHPLSLDLKNVSPMKVLNENFRFTIYDEDVIKDNKIMIFFNPIEHDFRSPSMSIEIFQIDLVVPNKDWVIKQGADVELRAYSIMNELAQQIDQQNVAGVGKVEISQSRVQSINKGYSIISAMITVANSKGA